MSDDRLYRRRQHGRPDGAQSVEGGHRVTVFDLSREAVERCVKAGAGAAGSIA